MKRVVRSLLALGGLAALGWALRDRLISISTPREEHPPAFRVPNSVSANQKQDSDTADR